MSWHPRTPQKKKMQSEQINVKNLKVIERKQQDKIHIWVNLRTKTSC